MVMTPAAEIDRVRQGGAVAGWVALDRGGVNVLTAGRSHPRAREGRGRLPNGDGTITRRRNGRWQGAVFVTTSRGVRRREYVYGWDRDQVRDRVATLLAREAAGAT